MPTKPRPATISDTYILTSDNAPYEPMQKVVVHSGGSPTADNEGGYMVHSLPPIHQHLHAPPTVGKAEDTTSPRPVTGSGEEEEDDMYEAIPGEEY